jgi:hypothetical protein
MKTFNDLEFGPHPTGLGGKIAQMDLGNGYKISVVGGGRGLYGDGETTFEVAMFNRMGEMITLGENDQVLGWQTIDEINEIIKKFDGQPILKAEI